MTPEQPWFWLTARYLVLALCVNVHLAQLALEALSYMTPKDLPADVACSHLLVRILLEDMLSTVPGCQLRLLVDSALKPRMRNVKGYKFLFFPTPSWQHRKHSVHGSDRGYYWPRPPLSLAAIVGNPCSAHNEKTQKFAQIQGSGRRWPPLILDQF